MIEVLASAVIVLAAIYLIGLAAVSFFMPGHARRFLDGFAGSARVHFLEMAIRLLVGCSLVVYAPHMLYPNAFWLFGWVLVVTTTVLLLIPWRWHHRFAQLVVPPITRHVWLFGIACLPLGAITLIAVLRAGTA